MLVGILGVISGISENVIGGLFPSCFLSAA